MRAALGLYVLEALYIQLQTVLLVPALLYFDKTIVGLGSKLVMSRTVGDFAGLSRLERAVKLCICTALLVAEMFDTAA